MAVRHCVTCGTDNSTFYLKKNRFEVRKCNSCSLVYLNSHANTDWIPKYYSANYFEAGIDRVAYDSYQKCEGFLTINFRKRIRHLSQYSPSGNVLDLGCAYGFFLKVLGEKHEGFGIDISPYAVDVCRKKYGLNVKTGPIDKQTFKSKYFSMITMWDVIEHLPDPKETLQILNTILKDNGILALTTGNVESLCAKVSGNHWHLYDFPAHLWFFSPRTLSKLVNDCGFKIVEMKYEWCYYSVEYLFERLLNTLINKSSETLLNPFRSILRKAIIPFSLFDIMYVVLKKR